MTEIEDIPTGDKPSEGRRRLKRKKTYKSDGFAYPLLCFDSETTNHGELLELSIFDLYGNEVYHEYFRPRAKSWPTDIHHITPAMVADKKQFFKHRDEIVKLLNSTPFLAGCALSNDLHTLRRYGIQISNKHKIFDIQNLFWLLNDKSDRQERNQAGLSAIGESYGLGFGDDKPHSATADTKLTLESLKALINDFIKKYDCQATCECNDRRIEDLIADLNEIYKSYTKAYSEALQIFRMKNSAGYVSVVKRERGYSFKSTRFLPTDQGNIVMSVPVADRAKAELDLRNYFERIQLKGLTGIFDLKPTDFDYIRNYKNTLDLETFLERIRSKDGVSEIVDRARKSVKDKKTAQQHDERGSAKGRDKGVRVKNRSTSKPGSRTRAATRAMRTAKKAQKNS